MGWRFVYLLDEDAPSEVPVEINAFKAQQRRWAKGVTEVALKLYPRILRSRLPARVKLEMFFRLTGNVSYPLMILTSLLQFPLLLVRYNQGFEHLMLLDLPLLFFSTASGICELPGKSGVDSPMLAPRLGGMARAGTSWLPILHA